MTTPGEDRVQEIAKDLLVAERPETIMFTAGKWLSDAQYLLTRLRAVEGKLREAERVAQYAEKEGLRLSDAATFQLQRAEHAEQRVAGLAKALEVALDHPHEDDTAEQLAWADRYRALVEPMLPVMHAALIPPPVHKTHTPGCDWQSRNHGCSCSSTPRPVAPAGGPNA